MVTTPTKPTVDEADLAPAHSSWLLERSALAHRTFHEQPAPALRELRPSGRDALEALLAFSAMHQQVRQRRALAARSNGFETVARPTEFEPGEQFVLDEVLQLVAERAIAITGADGLGIALAENNEIVLRASAGKIKPDVGARIQRDSAFSGACFRMAQIIRCDDTETDDRVNLYACRQLGARSMVAVPLCGRRGGIGLLEAFSAEPFGFNDSDVGSLELLAELILGALKPEDEDRFAQSAEVAEAALAVPTIPTPAILPAEKAPAEQVVAAKAVEPIVSPPAEPAPQVTDKPKLAFEETGKTISAAVPLPVPAPVPAPMPQIRTEPERVADDAIAPQIVHEIGSSSDQHPRIVLVLVLVVMASLLAGGVWWKLKNAQLDDVLVKPEPKITKPGVVKQP